MAGIRQFENYCLELMAKDITPTCAQRALHLLKDFKAQHPKNRTARAAVSEPVTTYIRSAIHMYDRHGWTQHQIAAHLNVNQGRVNEVLRSAP